MSNCSDRIINVILLIYLAWRKKQKQIPTSLFLYCSAKSYESNFPIDSHLSSSSSGAMLEERERERKTQVNKFKVKRLTWPGNK